MIIRVVSTVSLVFLLILVLYLPSAHPPEHFIEQLRSEHERNAQFWGDDHALHMLARMLDFHAEAKQVSPIPQTLSNAPAPNQMDAAVAAQMSQMNARLFSNPYFKSLDMLFALATYRFSVFVEWLPYLLVFVFASVVDGSVRRVVKSKEFMQHSPEIFALHVSLAIMLFCGTVVAFVIPFPLHPMLLPVVPICIGLFASFAIANFHRRG